MRTLRTTAAVAALVGGALFLGTGAVADPRAIPSQVFPAPFGVNIHYTIGGPGETAKLAKAFRVARMDFVWSSIEKQPGKYDWSAYDGLLKELEQNGVRPLWILDYGNDLYQQGPPRTTEARAAYARWAAAAAAHYKGRKIMWEFWNEPNGGGFWGGAPNPEEYARLVNDAAPAMRKADPHCTLLVGAFAGFPWEYIQTVFDRGALRLADAVTVHPYRGNAPETAGTDYDRLRRMIASALSGRTIPILSGEWGYSTNLRSGVSEERQAQYLVRQRLFNASQGIQTSIWYDWKNDGPDPNENEHRFGSVQQDLTPKPSYTAALTCTRTLSGYRFVRMLKNGPDDFVMLLRNAKGESALALWTLNDKHTFHVNGPVVRTVQMLGESRPGGKGPADISYGPSPVYALLGRSAEMDVRAGWAWLKPGGVLAAGKPVSAPLTLRNFSATPRAFTVKLSVRGGTVTPGTVSVRLKPGEERRILTSVTLWRREPQAQASVEISSRAGAGAPVREASSFALNVANPVLVSVSPVMGRGAEGSVDVTLDMPGGAPSGGLKVDLTHTRNMQVNPKRTSLEMVARPGGMRHLTVPISAWNTAPDYGYGVSVKSGDREIASLPPVGLRLRSDFEGSTPGGAPGDLAVHAEGDANGGSATLATAEAPGHGKVADLSVQFPAGWRYFVVTPADTVIPKGAVAIGMWVNGDRCGDTIRCRFVDATGQTFQPTYGAVDWTGWRWVTMRLDSSAAGSWGGTGDGVIHLPIRWDSVFLLDSASRAPHPAHVQFDDLTLLAPVS